MQLVLSFGLFICGFILGYKLRAYFMAKTLMAILRTDTLKRMYQDMKDCGFIKDENKTPDGGNQGQKT